MRIAVYGATGYTGRLVAAEVVHRGHELVLVGRDAARLAAVAPGGDEPADVRVATSDDHDGMVAAFTGADVVINCAGPFTQFGERVVRASVAARCHYLDATGEQPYIKRSSTPVMTTPNGRASR